MKDTSLKYEKVKYELENNKAFRERKNKNLYLGDLICKQLNVKNSNPKLLAETLKEYGTYDRVWRKNLREHPELRGTDYKQKTKLEDEAKKELGYESRN